MKFRPRRHVLFLAVLMRSFIHRLLPVDLLVSDEAGRLAEAAPAVRAAVRPLVGVHAQPVPPQMRHLLEAFPTVLAGVRLHGRFGGRCSVAAGRGMFSRYRRRLCVTVFLVALEERLCGEGQLAEGAQEDLRGRRYVYVFCVEEGEEGGNNVN